MNSKNTFTVMLFYGMAAMLMIAIHQNMYNGFAASYMFYMLTFILFLGYMYRKMNEPKETEEGESDKKTKFDVKFNKKGK